MEYFENEKSFLYDIKSIFHNFQGLSFDEIRKMADTSWSKKIFAKELTFCRVTSLQYENVSKLKAVVVV